MAALCRCPPPFINSPPSPHSLPINLTLGIMICGTHARITLPNWTHTLHTWEWYMAMRVVKKGRQKDMCYDEIERCAQITLTFLGSQLGGPVMEKYLRGALHSVWQRGLGAPIFHPCQGFNSSPSPPSHLLRNSSCIDCGFCTRRGTEGGLNPRPKPESHGLRLQVKSPLGWNSAWMGDLRST
jgi:hypothetical protein